MPVRLGVGQSPARHVGTPPEYLPMSYQEFAHRTNIAADDFKMYADFTRNDAIINAIYQAMSEILVTTRASAGMYQKADGSWTSFPANEPRIGDKGLLVETARTNSIRNNTYQGAAAGSPGTLPTNWTVQTPTGLTRTITLETINGVPCIRLRFQGTASSTTAGINITFDAITAAAALNGEKWSTSLFFRFNSTTGLPAGNLLLEIWNYTSASGFIGTGSASSEGTLNTAVSATLGRLDTRRTFGDATTAYARTVLRTGNISSGTVCDYEFVIGLPQLEAGGFTTSPIQTTGTAATRAGDVILLRDAGFLNTAAGSVYMKYTPIFAYDELGSSSPQFVQLDDGTLNNRFYLQIPNSEDKFWSVLVNGGSSTGFSNGGTDPNKNTVAKHAARYASNNLKQATNGTLSGQDSTVNIPTSAFNRMVIGSAGSTAFANAYIAELAYFDRALSDAELTAITS